MRVNLETKEVCEDLSIRCDSRESMRDYITCVGERERGRGRRREYEGLYNMCVGERKGEENICGGEKC